MYFNQQTGASHAVHTLFAGQDQVLGLFCHFNIFSFKKIKKKTAKRPTKGDNQHLGATPKRWLTPGENKFFLNFISIEKVD